MLRIGWDLDGVIAETAQGIMRVLVTEGIVSPELAKKPITSWEMCWDPVAQTGIPGVKWEHLERIFKDPGFWKGLEVNKAVADLIRRLSGVDCNYIITDRFWYPELGRDTRLWVDHNEIPVEGVYLSRPAEKWEFCREKKIDFFVDDRLVNVLSVAPHVKGAYLMARDWNTDAGALPGNVVRVTESELDRELSLLSRADGLEIQVAHALSDTMLFGGSLVGVTG